MKVCFDLDGVLVPDCNQIPNLGGVREFYQMTQYMRPLFRPRSSFGIITARSPRVRDITEAWIQQHLPNRPLALWHGCPDGADASAYKSMVLNANPGIELYIESDEKIVASLQHTVVTGCTILHLDRYLAQIFDI